MSESEVFQMLSLVSAMCSGIGEYIPPELANFMKMNCISTCAQCGKGEGDDEKSDGNKLQPCDGACKMVSYCSSSCQERHRPRHEKECMKRVDEIQEEEVLFEKITEEALFKQPPYVRTAQFACYPCLLWYHMDHEISCAVVRLYAADVSMQLKVGLRRVLHYAPFADLRHLLCHNL